MYISTPPSPEVENFQIKIYYPAGDWTGPAEPEADMLPSEPARRVAQKLKLIHIKYLLWIICCETWSLTFREDERLSVFENKVIWKIFGPKKEWRNLEPSDGERAAWCNTVETISKIRGLILFYPVVVCNAPVQAPRAAKSESGFRVKWGLCI